MGLGLLAFFWWADVILEGLGGQHRFSTLDNLKLGIVLFIIREVWFFFGFFWRYFHYSLTPNIEVGNVFPPFYCFRFNPFSVPLLNTIVLLSSGITVTFSHHNIINNLERETSLLFTVVLGVYFTILQGFEYITSSFTICDSVFGSIFFIATGFHGLHVLIGRRFLLFCLIRILQLRFRSFDHLSYEFAIWYWHFVDVVWLFLFRFIYYWGS